MRFPLAILFASLAIPTAGRAAEMAHSENFIILAPDKLAAEAVLAEAERFRGELARDWLGEELPPSLGRTTINVDLVEGENRAFTLPAGGGIGRYHKIWLTASRAEAIGSTLRHEVAHIVLHTRYPDMLPAWADEGIASLYDDPGRMETRERILAWYSKAGNWPKLTEMLSAKHIPADDQAAYSVAASLTRFLLARQNRQTLVAFALAGKRGDWDRALTEHYGIQDVAALQQAWQVWSENETGQNVRVVTPAGFYRTTTQPHSGS